MLVEFHAFQAQISKDPRSAFIVLTCVQSFGVLHSIYALCHMLYVHVRARKFHPRTPLHAHALQVVYQAESEHKVLLRPLEGNSAKSPTTLLTYVKSHVEQAAPLDLGQAPRCTRWRRH